MRGTATRAAVAQAKTPRLIDEADHKRTTLMVAAQAGDRIAYEALLRGCVALIKSVAYRQRVPLDCVDDVVQETLLTIHRARHTYDPTRPFSAWLRTIAQRRAIDVMRRQGYKGAREMHAPIAYENHPDPDDDPEQALDRTDRTAQLGRAVDSLPPGQRDAVKRLVLLEQSLDEAAASTRKTTGAIKVNLHRALNTLRTRMGAKD
jgi:RNA polymerase sigma factor (sigma-70 family)